MITIGLDLGDNLVRVAVARDGAAAPVAVEGACRAMPPILHIGNNPAAGGPGAAVAGVDDAPGARPLRRLNVTSLQRTLDFDRAIRLPQQQVSTVDMLAAILAESRQAALASTAAAGGDGAAAAPGAAGADSDDGDAGGVNCVVAVPQCFSQRQRSTLRTTVWRAGFPRVRLVDDSLAILLSSRDAIEGWSTILVCGWGSSAFSAALYKRKGNAFQPVGYEGDRDLGGDDLDSALADLLLEKVSATVGSWIGTPRPSFYQTLVNFIPDVRAFLGRGKPAMISLADVVPGPLPPAMARGIVTISVELYEKVLDEIVGRAMARIRKLLEDAQNPALDGVLVAGSTCQLEAVRTALKGLANDQIVGAPEFAMAQGAALYGQSISDEDWATATAPPGTLAPIPATRSDSPVSGGSGGGNRSDAPRRPDSSFGPPPATRGGAASPSDGPQPQEADPLVRHVAEQLVAVQEHDAAGRLDQAVGALDSVLGQLLQLSGELHRRAASSHRNAGRLTEAIQLLARGHQRDPESRFITFDLARICCECGNLAWKEYRTDDALAFAEHGIEVANDLDRSDRNVAMLVAYLLHIRACALSKKGRVVEALGDAELAMRLDPTVPNLQRTIDQLRADLRGRSPLPQPISIGQFVLPPQPVAPPAGPPVNPSPSESGTGTGQVGEDPAAGPSSPPLPVAPADGAAAPKGHDRNKPCICGSKKKYKNCCGRKPR